MAPSSEVGKMLKGSHVVDALSDELFDAVADGMTKQELKDGEVLVSEGQAMPAVYLVQSGVLDRVKQSSEEAQSDEFLVDSREAGSVTGLLHVLKSHGTTDPAFATVKARGEATVWAISADDLQALLKKNPDLALGVLASFARQLRSQKKAVSVLTKKNGDDFKGIKVICYDAAGWVRDNFQRKADKHNEQASPEEEIKVDFTSDTLSSSSVSASVGYDVVSLFVNDTADGGVLKSLGAFGIKMVAMRCAGFDRVDTNAAEALGMTVVRVPAYSPYAVAEHAIAILMALNRKVHRASIRTREANFSLDGLEGFDMHGKTVSVVGCGRIGQCLCNILLGFGVKLLCVDGSDPSKDLVDRGARYVEIDEAWKESDVVFLQVPLLPSTKHMLNADVLPKLKKGMALINTSRGGLVDTEALMKGLRSGIISMAGLDVYENEAGYFFRDCSHAPVQDTVLAELLSFNNVILTGHQAFFTQEAIDGIVDTTFENIDEWRTGTKGKDHKNSVY